MENLTKFTEACKRFGVDEMDVFQSVDLWERRNIPQVSQCILALGRAVSKWTTIATLNERWIYACINS